MTFYQHLSQHKIHSPDIIYTAQWSGYNVCTPFLQLRTVLRWKLKKHQTAYLSTKERQELGRTPALFMATKLRDFNETSGQFTALFLTRCRDDLQPYLRQPKQVFWAKTRSFLSRDQMFLVPAEPLETKLQHFSGFAVFAKLINSMSTNPNTIQKKAVEIQTAGKLRLQSENMSYCVVCRGHCWML